MDWMSYLAILRRRWVIIAAILVLDLAATGYLYHKAQRSAGYQSCLELYVGDAGAASYIIAPGTNLMDTQSQALAGETAANFFADDVVDVSGSRSVSSYIQTDMQHGSALVSGPIAFSISGSRVDRTVNLCVNDADASQAGVAAAYLARAMTTDRKLFFGPVAKRIYTNVIGAPVTSPVPSGHAALTALLRLVLGLLVALGVGFVWDALDPTVRDRADAERALGVPVISS
ncbi:MAG TPA: hypothetical protein VFB58_09725 [Chloroflexota bacterium]|nr:hypothetical protein [Chloroflexota bacterium]